MSPTKANSTGGDSVEVGSSVGGLVCVNADGTACGELVVAGDGVERLILVPTADGVCWKDSDSVALEGVCSRQPASHSIIPAAASQRIPFALKAFLRAPAGGTA